MVERFYDAASAEAASAEFGRIFSERRNPTDIPDIVIGTEEAPEGRVGLLKLLTRARLAASNGEARRLVQQGGVRIDDEKVADPRAVVVVKDGMILRAGKRGFARITCASCENE